MRPALALLSTALLLLPFCAAAQHLELAKCRAIPDAAARLLCYDQVPLPPDTAGQSSGAVPALAPAPAVAAGDSPKESRFGLHSRPEADALESIAAHVPEGFSGWRPGDLIKLSNGQVWRVVDDSPGHVALKSTKVVVRRGALGSFFMEFEGTNRSPRVRRAQ